MLGTVIVIGSIATCLFLIWIVWAIEEYRFRRYVKRRTKEIQDTPEGWWLRDPHD